jgi:histidine triad (HIT) family protein
LKRGPVRKGIGWGFAHADFLLPVDRLRETPNLLAFHHPHPSYPFHVIIVPRRAIASFADLDPADSFLAELVAVVHFLVEEFHLPPYRLIVNGGEYQEFPHLHFHLISDVGATHASPLPKD